MIVALFVPAECPKGGGYVGYIRKALEKGYLEHPGSGSACCTDSKFEIFVFFGQCLCYLLAVFVNRQPPCPETNSRHVLLRPQMRRNNLWFAKEHTLGVLPGCGLVARRPLGQAHQTAECRPHNRWSLGNVSKFRVGTGKESQAAGLAKAEKICSKQ